MTDSSQPRWWQAPTETIHHLLNHHATLRRDGVGVIWICSNRITHKIKMVFQPHGVERYIPIPDQAALEALAQQPDADSATRYLLH